MSDLWRSLLLTMTLVVACYVKPVDFSDKTCPCAQGYTCVDDRCVSGTVGDGDADSDIEADADTDSDGDGDTDADGDGDGDGDSDTDADEEPCTPAVGAADFGADWATSESIRWQWEPVGEADDFLAYELVIGESVEDVERRSGTARVFTSEDNPELGVYLLPRTGGEDPVRATITDRLTPATSYVAQLVVTDTALCSFTTPVAAKATHIDPPSEIVIFRDSVPPGSYPLPSNFLPEPDEDGGYYLEYVPAEDGECAPTSTMCGDNLRYQGFHIDLSRISAGAFATTALFEFELSVDAESSGFWSDVGLTFEDQNHIYLFHPWTMRPQCDHVVFQVPLRALWRTDDTLGEVLLDRDEIASSDLVEFRIFGTWNRDAVVRVDEIRIRY